MLEITKMSSFDWTIAALLFVGFIYGYSRGFIRQLLSLGNTVIALFVAYFLSDDVAVWLKGILPKEALLKYESYAFIAGSEPVDRMFVKIVSFLVVFIIIKLLLLTAGHLLDWLAKAPVLNQMNRMAGALLFLFELIFLLLLLFQLGIIWPNDSIQQWIADAMFGPYMLEWSNELWTKVKELPAWHWSVTK